MNKDQKGNLNMDFQLHLDENGLALHSPKFNPIKVDFSANEVSYRLAHGGGLKQMLLKAIGVKKNFTPTVIDTTAGLGMDAFIMAAAGCTVTMLERSPIIHALLEDGLRRAALDPQIAPIVSRLTLIHQDSCQYLEQLPIIKTTEQAAEQACLFPTFYYPDVIYLDPMFPPKKKSAQVKKEMVILKELLADEPDNTEQLLTIALSRAKKRVVIKRPRLAELVGNKKPDIVFTGRSCRYDVFLM